MGGDIIDAIPLLYQQMQMPIGLITIMIGAVAGAFSLHKGVGKAAGKMVGGIALAALVFGGVNLAHSINQTVMDHGGGTMMLDTSY
jgi:hypothetical protein